MKKYLILFLFILVIDLCANAQTARVVGDPCFQLSDSLGTAVTRWTSFQPYEPEPYWYMPVKVDVGYYYASSKTCDENQKITKPIVIIDGFDAGDKRRFREIYGELNYTNNANRKTNFIEELQAQGYDVVVVNFPKYYLGMTNTGPLGLLKPYYRDGGADYIERNADALLGVILMLKDELVASGSTEQLTIVGTSMAGLISRYTLAYMEKMHALYPYNGWNHNTKLWVSFDAPHNGANIPLGAQEFLHYWGLEGSEGSARNYKNKINSPAARQFLLHHRNQPVGFPSTPQVNWYRTRFMTALQNNGLAGSNGYPMNLRKVAVANGSQAGALTGFSGQMNLEMSLNMAANGLRVGGSQTYSTRSYGGTGVVSYVEKSRPSVLGGLTNHPEIQYSNGTPNSVSYDIAPGGMFDVYDVIRKEGLAANPAFGVQIFGTGFVPIIASFNMPNPVHCFIPTKSALGFTGSNQDLGENLTGRSLVCTGETPFNAYYAPIGGNEGHARLNQNNVDWLKREIGITVGEPNTNPPPTPPANYAITINHLTPTANCVGAKQTYGYTIPAGVLRSGDIVTSTRWFVIGSLRMDTPDDQPIIEVSPLANTGIVGTVRVEITTSNFCIGKGVASLDVYSALSDYEIGIKKNEPGAACPASVSPAPLPDDEPIIIDNSVKTYSLDLTPAFLASIGTILTYNWSTTGGLTITSAANIPTVTVSHAFNGTISVEITSTGLCRGKGGKTLAVKVGSPVMLSSTTLDTGCFGSVEAVFVEDVTSITLLHFKPTSSFPGIVYPTTTGRLLFTEAGRHRIFATNACGNSIIYDLTIISTPDLCKTVEETPKKSDVLPDISVFPNPADTYLEVANILAGSEVKIYTKIGVLVHSEKSENDKIRLDISKLTTDLYILEAVLPNNVKVRKQIVKQ